MVADFFTMPVHNCFRNWSGTGTMGKAVSIVILFDMKSLTSAAIKILLHLRVAQ